MSLQATPVQSPYRRLRRLRTFWLLWSGSAVSTLGDHFFALALMWYIYSNTGSSLQVAGITVAVQLTYVLIGPVAGVFADRWDRRRTMIVCDALSALIVLSMAVVTWRWGLSLWAAIIAVFLLEAIGQFFSPSRSAFLPTVIPREDLVTANGIFSGTRHAMGVAGQALGGIVISVFGAVSAFIVDAASFVLSAVSLALIRNPEPVTSSSEHRAHTASGLPRFWSEMRSGLAVVMHHPLLRVIVSYAVMINAFFAMIEPVLPAYVSRHLHAGAWALGTIQSAQFAGALAGGFLAGALHQRIRAGRLFIINNVVSGLVMILTGLVQWVPAVVALWMLSGFMLSVNGVVEQSLNQALIPQEYLGRATSFIQAAAMALMPLGALVGGYLANVLGPGTIFIVIGVAYFIGALFLGMNGRIRTADVRAD